MIFWVSQDSQSCQRFNITDQVFREITVLTGCTLVIADTRERNHDRRIAHARDKTPGLSRERAYALNGEASNMNGGADYSEFGDKFF